jgi:anti-sigma-K factor RskA
MSIELTHNQVLELLPAYALGALESDEFLAVESYLQQHPELQARLHALEAAAAQLAFAAPEARLPADARQRILARARADLAPIVPVQHTNAHPANPPRSEQRSGQPAADRRRFQLTGLSRWAALGGAAIAILLALYVGRVQAQLNELNQQISTMHDLVIGLQEQLRGNQEVIGLLVDRDVQLAGTPQAPGASADFYVSGDRGTLVARGLGPLPATQTYQLWLVIDGHPTPFGIFQAQPGQPAVLTVAVPASARGFAIVDVSIEPAGGSQQITKETIVLRGAVS